MKASRIFRPPDDRTCSSSQINKLLVMLSKKELIWSEFNRDNREWDYDIQDAINWVNKTFGYGIKMLEQLSHGQIGSCYEELGE